MKGFLSGLLLVLALGHTANCEGAEATLNDLLLAFLAGASSNDASVHDRFWAEDLVYTSSSGARFGKAEIMDGLDASAETVADGPDYGAQDISIRVFGNTAALTFTLVATNQHGEETRYYNSGFLRKREGQWQAIVWQATLAAD